eukprot:Nk52_evm80s745 gene=Nk52_evmTU80s745
MKPFPDQSSEGEGSEEEFHHMKETERGAKGMGKDKVGEIVDEDKKKEKEEAFEEGLEVDVEEAVGDRLLPKGNYSNTKSNGSEVDIQYKKVLLYRGLRDEDEEEEEDQEEEEEGDNSGNEDAGDIDASFCYEDTRFQSFLSSPWYIAATTGRTRGQVIEQQEAKKSLLALVLGAILFISFVTMFIWFTSDHSEELVMEFEDPHRTRNRPEYKYQMMRDPLAILHRQQLQMEMERDRSPEGSGIPLIDKELSLPTPQEKMRMRRPKQHILSRRFDHAIKEEDNDRDTYTWGQCENLNSLSFLSAKAKIIYNWIFKWKSKNPMKGLSVGGIECDLSEVKDVCVSDCRCRYKIPPAQSLDELISSSQSATSSSNPVHEVNWESVYQKTGAMFASMTTSYLRLVLEDPGSLVIKYLHWSGRSKKQIQQILGKRENGKQASISDILGSELEMFLVWIMNPFECIVGRIGSSCEIDLHTNCKIDIDSSVTSVRKTCSGRGLCQRRLDGLYFAGDNALTRQYGFVWEENSNRHLASAGMVVLKSFACNCKEGFAGKYCEEVSGKCKEFQGRLCNGPLRGKCKFNYWVGSKACVCDSGYSGPDCGTKIERQDTNELKLLSKSLVSSHLPKHFQTVLDKIEGYRQGVAASSALDKLESEYIVPDPEISSIPEKKATIKDLVVKLFRLPESAAHPENITSSVPIKSILSLYEGGFVEEMLSLFRTKQLQEKADEFLNPTNFEKMRSILSGELSDDVWKLKKKELIKLNRLFMMGTSDYVLCSSPGPTCRHVDGNSLKAEVITSPFKVLSLKTHSVVSCSQGDESCYSFVNGGLQKEMLSIDKKSSKRNVVIFENDVLEFPEAFKTLYQVLWSNGNFNFDFAERLISYKKIEEELVFIVILRKSYLNYLSKSSPFLMEGNVSYEMTPALAVEDESSMEKTEEMQSSTDEMEVLVYDVASFCPEEYSIFPSTYQYLRPTNSSSEVSIESERQLKDFICLSHVYFITKQFEYYGKSANLKDTIQMCKSALPKSSNLEQESLETLGYWSIYFNKLGDNNEKSGNTCDELKEAFSQFEKISSGRLEERKLSVIEEDAFQALTLHDCLSHELIFMFRNTTELDEANPQQPPQSLALEWSWNAFWKYMNEILNKFADILESAGVSKGLLEINPWLHLNITGLYDHLFDHEKGAIPFDHAILKVFQNISNALESLESNLTNLEKLDDEKIPSNFQEDILRDLQPLLTTYKCSNAHHEKPEIDISSCHKLVIPIQHSDTMMTTVKKINESFHMLQKCIKNKTEYFFVDYYHSYYEAKVEEGICKDILDIKRGISRSQLNAKNLITLTKTLVQAKKAKYLLSPTGFANAVAFGRAELSVRQNLCELCSLSRIGIRTVDEIDSGSFNCTSFATHLLPITLKNKKLALDKKVVSSTLNVLKISLAAERYKFMEGCNCSLLRDSYIRYIYALPMDLRNAVPKEELAVALSECSPDKYPTTTDTDFSKEGLDKEIGIEKAASDGKRKNEENSKAKELQLQETESEKKVFSDEELSENPTGASNESGSGALSSQSIAEAISMRLSNRLDRQQGRTMGQARSRLRRSTNELPKKPLKSTQCLDDQYRWFSELIKTIPTRSLNRFLHEERTLQQQIIQNGTRQASDLKARLRISQDTQNFNLCSDSVQPFILSILDHSAGSAKAELALDKKRPFYTEILSNNVTSEWRASHRYKELLKEGVSDELFEKAKAEFILFWLESYIANLHNHNSKVTSAKCSLRPENKHEANSDAKSDIEMSESNIVNVGNYWYEELAEDYMNEFEDVLSFILSRSENLPVKQQLSQQSRASIANIDDDCYDLKHFSALEESMELRFDLTESKHLSFVGHSAEKKGSSGDASSVLEQLLGKSECSGNGVCTEAYRMFDPVVDISSWSRRKACVCFAPYGGKYCQDPIYACKSHAEFGVPGDLCGHSVGLGTCSETIDPLTKRTTKICFNGNKTSPCANGFVFPDKSLVANTGTLPTKNSPANAASNIVHFGEEKERVCNRKIEACSSSNGAFAQYQSSDPNAVCNGHGICTSAENYGGHFCDCSSPLYTGPRCELKLYGCHLQKRFKPASKAKSIYSICGYSEDPSQSRGECVCNEKHFGEVCAFQRSIDTAAASIGQGEIHLPMTCQCKPGWGGKNCGVKTCKDANGSECNGHGECVVAKAAQGFPEFSHSTCKCHKGYMGELCEHLS